MIRYIAGIVFFVLIGVANATERPSPIWTISVDVDEMSSELATTATAHYFRPGPNGNLVKFASLLVRKHPRWGTDVMLGVYTSGKPVALVCTLPEQQDNCTVLVKFDNSPAKTYATNISESGSPNLLFIDDHPQFIQRLQASKLVKIEVLVVNYGSTVLTFETAGFPAELFSVKH